MERNISIGASIETGYRHGGTITIWIRYGPEPHEYCFPNFDNTISISCAHPDDYGWKFLLEKKILKKEIIDEIAILKKEIADYISAMKLNLPSMTKITNGIEIPIIKYLNISLNSTEEEAIKLTTI